jgi:cytochrome P450
MNTVDLFSPQFVEDPYAALRQLRHESPVCKAAPLGYWGLTRYDDVVAAISNPALFSSRAMTDPNAVFPEIRRYLQTEALVAMDPPKHGQTRRVITTAFSMKKEVRGDELSRARGVPDRADRGAAEEPAGGSDLCDGK